MADEQKEMSVQERLQALTILGPVQGSLKDAFNQTSTSSSTVRNGTFDEIAQMSGFSHPNDIAWLWMQIKYLPAALSHTSVPSPSSPSYCDLSFHCHKPSSRRTSITSRCTRITRITSRRTWQCFESNTIIPMHDGYQIYYLCVLQNVTNASLI
eukprot:449986_1